MMCIMVGMGTVRAQETQEALSQAHDSLRVRTVYVHDTIYIERPAVEAAQPDSSEIIYTKPVGRFDRGIINYRFIPKKKWVGGLTFSYINYDGEDSRMLFSLIKDFDCNFRTISVRPFVGYAFKDNVIVGLKAGYNHTVADLGNISLNIDDDLSFDLKTYAIRKTRIASHCSTVRMWDWTEASASDSSMKVRFPTTMAAALSPVARTKH